MQYRRAFEATGLPYAMLVNGSFVTDRLDPGDIDFCVLYESTALQALDAVVQSTVKHLFDLTDSLPRLRCHAFPLAIYPFTSIRFSAFVRDMAYWSRVFGVDRKGREKGFLHIGERGVI